MVGIMKDVIYLTFENIYVIVSMVVILVIVTTILIMRFILTHIAATRYVTP